MFVSGPVGDAIGRKNCYCLFLTIWVAVGAVGAYTTNLYLWMLTRFVVGFTSLGYNNCLVVYLVEITTGKWRNAFFYYFMSTGWDLGIITLGILAYFIRNITDLELVIALSNLPYLLAWILMLESPR